MAGLPALIGWRLAQMALVLAVLSFLGWMLIGLMPGDPIRMAIASDPRLSAADISRMMALQGLDQPLLERYLGWLTQLAQGQFGYSRLFAQPVTAVLWPALLSTLVLLGWSLLVAVVFGLGLGALAALRPKLAPTIGALCVLAQSTPTFWLGMVLIIFFAVHLGWLPAGGTPDQGRFGAALRFLILPVTTLAFANLAGYARYTAAGLRSALATPWARTARARGASTGRVVWRHALPNAAVPLLTLVALDIGSLVSGALVTETVFARPGMGKLLADAVLGSDQNLALLAMLLAAATTMLAALGADLVQRAIDPRLRDT